MAPLTMKDVDVALGNIERRFQVLEQRRIEPPIKTALISLLGIVKQQAVQNHEIVEFVLETLPQAAALRAKLGDTKQSHIGLLRRLDEATRQVDRA